MEKIIDSLKDEFEKALDHLKGELAKLHSGRASAGLIENIGVDYYGGRAPLKALASITITGPREIKIDVWDQGAIKAIEDALMRSSLGSAPQVEGNVIRLYLPPLSSETREKIIKVLKTKLEEAKISLRQSREQAWDKIQELTKQGIIREDDKFRSKDKIQKLMDECHKKIEEMGKGKEGEIRG